MDLEEIKRIIEVVGGRFIIMDNGKPTLVISKFEDYKKNLVKNNNEPTAVKPVEKRNEETASQKTPRESEEDLTIEDLPL